MNKSCYNCYFFKMDVDNIFNGSMGLCLQRDEVVYIDFVCEFFNPFIIEEKKNVNPS